jgi:predicted DNA-binding transcriptional regulator YafY
MRRINKIVALISLLSNRHHISMDTIKTVCGISERSAYRYLNAISEANYPVHFDKGLGAYRLAERTAKISGGYSIGDIVMIVIGLKLLAKRLNVHYGEDIEELVRRLVSEKAFPLEDVLQSFDSQLAETEKDADLTTLMSSMLMNTAIVSDRKVRILIEDPDTGEKLVSLTNPALTFQNEWKVISGRGIDAEEAFLSEIKKVSIL